MKKFTLVLVMAICAISLFAQKIPPPSVTNGKPVPLSTRDNEFLCLSNSVFAQVFPTFDDGYFADNAYYWVAVADDYSAIGPFSTMRFWGVNHISCPPGPSQTFEFNFYNGNPCSGGQLVNSFTKTVTPLPMGIIPSWSNAEVYQVDVNFGTNITLLNGWVRVSRINPGDGCIFAWLAFDDGFVGNAISQDQSGNCSFNNTNMLFCLGGEEVPQTPVSNWALFIGIGLILVFTVVRFRKMV
jgi:hypothetical protein